MGERIPERALSLLVENPGGNRALRERALTD